ncbi:MAG: chromosome segregation SMC family protein [Candidatus Micrarchaeia archaeon]
MGAYIRRLKCRNFKSFKRADMSFIPGFQAIMGPNGSGKSNVCDAIRFALGEMKFSALRAKSIKDLINSESDHAEVTLEVRTPDGDISVTRRVTSDGKSGYRLNGKKAKRGTVIELLKKYEIENGAHNVIGQGEVQRIVEMNAVERRRIIDEIAGVAEFDIKKDEAMRELDVVQQRINDTKILVKEKEGYLRELAGERDKALRYEGLRKEVHNLRNSVLHYEIQRAESEYESVTKEYALSKAKVSEIDEGIAGIDARVGELNRKIKELSDSINKSTTDNKAYREYEAMRTELALANARKDALMQQKVDIEKRLAEADTKKRELEERLSASGGSLGESEAALLKLKQEYAEVKARVDAARKRDSGLAKESESLGKEIAELEQGIEKKDDEAKAASIKISECELRIKSKSEERERALALSQGEVSGELQAIAKQLRGLEEELERKKKEMEDLFVKERKCNERNAEIDKQLLKLKEEYSRYKGLAAQMQSEVVVNFIRELRDKGVVKGIYGPVQELCTFDPKYATAIESAVGGRRNYIIVENIAASDEAIKQLRARKIGRATFLPLNMNLPAASEKTPNFPGVLGRLIDFVEYDPKFTVPMQYVFGDTLLITDIETAKDVGLIGKARLVTLEGDVIDKTSAVTGGFFVSSMRLAERKRAEEVGQKIEALQMEKESAVAEMYALRDQATQLRRERAEIEVRIKSLQVDSEGRLKAAKEIEDARARAKAIESEIASLDKERRALVNEYEKLKATVEQLKDKLAAARKRKSDIDFSLFNRQDNSQERLAELAEAITKAESELAGRSTESTLLRNQLSEVKAAISSIKNELAQNKSEQGALEKKIASLAAEIEGKKGEIEKAGKKIRELMQARDEIQHEIDAHSENKGAQLKAKERVMQELGRLEVRKATLEQRLVDLKAELTDQPFELVEGSISKLKSDLSVKEGELAAMGAVNLLAPKMYDEKKQEFDEISDRLFRLEKEREAVVSMIDEVEKRKIVVFMEAFEKVNSNFQALFAQAFGSGRAYLALQKPREPFEGGLDVKLIRNESREERIESLSGGEKSVIALLLVFAMHMYKASAFYILDEVESALDKIRSRLVAELIAKLSRKTQFIVVSHNDTVIAAAEAVLGVSRVGGDSRVVSLALNGNMQAILKDSGAQQEGLVSAEEKAKSG